MDDSIIDNITKSTGCLIGIAGTAAFIGILIGVMGLTLFQTVQQIPPTYTSMPCQITLDVVHDLYDTVEAYNLNQLPIGQLEIGVYPVVAHTDVLFAVDWRGSLPYPPPFHLLDWVEPVDGVDEMYGDCSRVINLITATPTPVG